MYKRLFIPLLAALLVGVFAAPVAAAAPEAPASITVTAGPDSVSAIWTPPAAGDPVDSYLVSLSGDAVDSTTTTGTSAAFAGLAPGSYTITVAGVNVDGTGPGISGSATIDPTAPGAPTGVSAPVDDGGDPGITYAVSFGAESGSTTGTSLTFTNVAAGTYTASVTASNSGGSSTAGVSGSFTVDAPIGAPGAPTGVSAVVSGQSVTVSWSAPVDDGGDPLIAYTVSFGAESGETESTSLTFTNVAPGTYTASVTASNSGGSSTAASSNVFTVNAPIDPPSVPQNVVASVTAQTITVSFSPPADDGGDGNITYQVGVTGLTPQSGTGTTYTFAGVPAGDYTATVSAANSAGQSGTVTSNTVTVQAPATVPGVPGDLTATPAGTGVAISWTPAAANGSAILEYQVNLNGQTSPFPDSPATYSNLAPGNYTVSVAAVNGVGTGPPASTSFTIEQPIVAPSAPQNVSASVSGRTVNVSWGAPSDDGGDASISYTATLSNGASQLNLTGTSAQFANVPAGDYTVTVTATNSAGDSPPATSSSFSVFTAPSAPTNVAAAADGSSVIATWDPPASNGNRPLTGYQVRLEQNGVVQETRNIDPATDSVRFDGRTPGVYSVVVTATNDQGSGPGASVDVEVGSTAPSAPTNVSGFATFQTVTVTWDPPLSAGNTAITGYEIIVGPIEQTVDVGTRSVVFADVPVVDGGYVAEVRAINSGGTSLAGLSGVIVVETVFSPFESSEALIAQQYADFLGRSPDQAGLTYWEGVLGADRNQGPIVIENFMRSAEFAPRRSVARLYLAFFDRAPDRAGFDFWAQSLQRGGQLNDIAAAFADSQEFRNTYGELNDAEFIALVYNNVLLRTPDLEGFQFWLQRMQDPNVSRGDLMVAFSESAEFKRNSSPAVDVIMTYRGMLDRAPDSAGFAFWVGEVAGRSDALQTLIFNFLVSEEYANRVG